VPQCAGTEGEQDNLCAGLLRWQRPVVRGVERDEALENGRLAAAREGVDEMAGAV